MKDKEVEIEVDLHAASMIAMALIKEGHMLREGANAETYALAFLIAAESAMVSGGASKPWDALRTGLNLLEQQCDAGNAERTVIGVGTGDQPS